MMVKSCKYYMCPKIKHLLLETVRTKTMLQDQFGYNSVQLGITQYNSVQLHLILF